SQCSSIPTSVPRLSTRWRAVAAPTGPSNVSKHAAYSVAFWSAPSPALRRRMFSSEAKAKFYVRKRSKRLHEATTSSNMSRRYTAKVTSSRAWKPPYGPSRARTHLKPLYFEPPIWAMTPIQRRPFVGRSPAHTMASRRFPRGGSSGSSGRIRFGDLRTICNRCRRQSDEHGWTRLTADRQMAESWAREKPLDRGKGAEWRSRGDIPRSVHRRAVPRSPGPWRLGRRDTRVLPESSRSRRFCMSGNRVLGYE